MGAINTKLYNIVTSIQHEILYFESTYNIAPCMIFMSEGLFRFLAYPDITVSSDFKYYFYGIEVKPYPSPGFEYYLAEKRGEFWEFE